MDTKINKFPNWFVISGWIALTFYLPTFVIWQYAKYFIARDIENPIISHWMISNYGFAFIVGTFSLILLIIWLIISTIIILAAKLKVLKSNIIQFFIVLLIIVIAFI